MSASQLFFCGSPTTAYSGTTVGVAFGSWCAVVCWSGGWSSLKERSRPFPTGALLRAGSYFGPGWRVALLLVLGFLCLFRSGGVP